MANSIELKATIADVILDKLMDLTLVPVTEKVYGGSTVDAAAADVEIELGSITNPKLLIVIGAPGISIKLVTGTGTAINANPFTVVCKCDTEGFAQASFFVSNSGSQPQNISWLAAE